MIQWTASKQLIKDLNKLDIKYIWQVINSIHTVIHVLMERRCLVYANITGYLKNHDQT